ncbi:MAG: ketoacyl-ACP synthase III [Myxococcales bacterium]|nr:ketoacyl-ACP synthase III [Myxococcales bacterium]
MHHTILRSTGIHVPKIELPNAVLRDRFAATAPEFVEKMEASTGIRTRFLAHPEWATSDLAVEAAKQALARAGLAASDVDLILLGTDSPDYVTPATSVVVQHKLGAKRAGTFDVGCACASFPTAIANAHGLMATNKSLRHVLVVGAYRMSKLSDPSDPNSFFYGDGAGAAVLERSEEPGILGATFRADGAFASFWGIFAGGTAEPASHAAVEAGRTQVRVTQKYPPEVNDEGWPAIVRSLSRDVGFGMNDIDLVIFTQVRRRTIEKVMAALELPLDKTHMIMDKWGYTGSACIPMALHDAIEQGRVRPGQLVVLVGSGVGHNQAGVALRVTDRLVH